MDAIFRNVRAVGFDLDGTLYAHTPRIDEKIAALFAEKVLAKMPELGSLEAASAFSEKKYKELESRKKVLEMVGYANAGELMEQIFRDVDSAQFLNEDKALVALLAKIRKAKNYMYLITTAPREDAKKKLEKLGIDENIFDAVICGDHELIAKKPKNETVFRHVVERSGIPAGEHVYVGDREKSDILAPKAVGMKAIAVGTKIPAADAWIREIYDIENLIL